MRAHDLPELDELHRIVEAGGDRLEVRTLAHVHAGRLDYPIHAVVLGTRDPLAPAVGFFAGVHGLERVGTHVLLAFLGSVVARLHWDDVLHRQLERIRLVFMPLVNPGGMAAHRRANPNGVDLMRNAPIDSRERVAPFLGGHRLTRALPWYRGPAGAALEAESQALCSLVRTELLARPLSLALDCHSGFGMRDRVWLPHAHTRRPFARIAEVHGLVRRFEAASPDHAYVFEPQSRHYLAHGDLWDHLAVNAEGGGVFLPLTLELGSWRWIRKSPRQVLSRLGIFNPMPPDRLQRVRRNHLVWLAFLCHAAETWREWLPVGPDRVEHERDALERWYGAKR